jgi:hypothetical protein
MDICLSSRKDDHNHAGLVATAMRIVNDSAVVAAKPGIRRRWTCPWSRSGSPFPGYAADVVRNLSQ